jgi:hypothetical protein
MLNALKYLSGFIIANAIAYILMVFITFDIAWIANTDWQARLVIVVLIEPVIALAICVVFVDSIEE